MLRRFWNWVWNPENPQWCKSSCLHLLHNVSIIKDKNGHTTSTSKTFSTSKQTTEMLSFNDFNLLFINSSVCTCRQQWRIGAAACISSWLSPTRHPSTFTSDAGLPTSRCRRDGGFSGSIRRTSWKYLPKSELARSFSAQGGTADNLFSV